MATHRPALEHGYGLADGDYEWLAARYDESCWICKAPEKVPGRRLAIDHDHDTGAVRGLLCGRCNIVIGRMGDDPQLLRQAATYLDEVLTRYTDCCPACSRSNIPNGLIETSEHGGTRFQYRCACGHRWACWHATKGIPHHWGHTA